MGCFTTKRREAGLHSRSSTTLNFHRWAKIQSEVNPLACALWINFCRLVKMTYNRQGQKKKFALVMYVVYLLTYRPTRHILST